MTFPRSSASECERQYSPTKIGSGAKPLFCWARQRFAPAKCRNALLLSSKSAKLSFSQEKLLTTHCHEPAHISHQWTCERERFASQGAKRRGRIRSVAMIHRMTETEPQGSVNTTCPSTRTNVRFLSSLGRLVLSSMLDAKEQGRSAPRKAPSYLSPNQGIDPLT